MKKLLALGLALALLLSGCARMLERDYYVTADHEENPVHLSDAYRVETYSALLSALRSYLEEGMDTGVLRVPTTYPGNLTVDLEHGRRQLLEEEPLGCYALNDVTFHTARIIAYYEVTATFDYRVPPAEYVNMETLRDSWELDTRMAEVMESFGGQFTALLTLPGATDTALSESLRRVYNDRPDLALGYPELEVAYYPENGAQAVAEVTVTYPQSAAALRQRQRDTLRAAQPLLDELEQVDGYDTMSIYRTVMGRLQYDPEGGSTAADAFLDGKANDEGLARAYLLLCRLKDNGGASISNAGGSYETVVNLYEDGVTTVSFKPESGQGGENP